MNKISILINRYSTLLITLPAIFIYPLTCKSIYKDSIIFILTPFSVMYHNLNGTSRMDIFAYLDNFGIIFTNCSVIKYTSIWDCIVVSSILYKYNTAKKLIHVLVVLYIYSLCVEKYHYILLTLGIVLKIIGFKMYKIEDRWTAYNRLLWHGGNSIYLYLGGLLSI